MAWATLITATNAVFVWEGWKALAAIGTFLAVFVALNRDGKIEQKDRIKHSYAISALIDLVGSSLLLLKRFQAADDDEKLASAYNLMDRTGLFEKSLETMDSLKMSDLPTVETINTVSVLKAEYKHLLSLLNKDEKKRPEGISTVVSIFERCLADLEKEHRFVAGRDYYRVTSDGHRAWRSKKLFGGPRKQSLRVITAGFKMLISGQAPKREKAGPKS